MLKHPSQQIKTDSKQKIVNQAIQFKEVVMKALALFTAALLFAGCAENAVEPIVAKAGAAPAPAFRVLQIKENVEFKAPNGFVGVVEVAGEIRYNALPLAQGTMAKELPVERKAIYDLRIEGNGQMVFGAAAAENKAALGKPEMWIFAGGLTAIVQDGTRGIEVIFNITGAPWTAEYRMTFALAGGVLTKGENEIVFHPE